MQQRLLNILRDEGVVSADRLIRELGISRATLSRLIRKAPIEVVRLGRTRAIQYGLARALPGLRFRIPVYRIDEAGELAPVGTLMALHQHWTVLEPGPELFEGLPPEVADMAPQGFIGRAFPGSHADLDLPHRIQDWSDDHVLLAVARRGEDLPGNLIVGSESAERWRDQEIRPTDRSQYPELARRALAGQQAGSSAGGEQPKFTAFVDGRHCIVKFAVAGDSPAELRWRDLLWCEAIALEVLGNAGVTTAAASIYVVGGNSFLEVERFDRIGERGRRAVLTLAGVDDPRHGLRDSWSEAAQRLVKDRLISPADGRRIRLLEAFARLIANTDRHFYNLSFFVNDTFVLAPVYDQLPMLFAPVSGQIVEREFKIPIPDELGIDVWDEAARIAQIFWERVSGDQRISHDFRQIAQSLGKK